MKKAIVAGLVIAMVVGLGLTFDGPNGNGAPSGYHKNLNIIGVPNDKNENYTGGNGSVVFVDRTGSTTFYVQGGNSYEIRDHDGTDGEVGTGPNPLSPDYEPGIIFPYDAAITGQTWRVQIWVRLVGPTDPGNTADWSSYYWDGAFWQPWASFTLSKSSKFSLKTAQLLANGYENMMWELDPGTKFRICQMRIYFLDE